MREQIGEFEKAAMEAVELYTDDKRVLGNTLLAQARQHSVIIDDRISALFDDLNREVDDWTRRSEFSAVRVPLL